ncbi:hypothetical protein [Pseudomonas sp. AN-1]|jgi:BRCT domain type II-containing protein|uniref:hypothetical protein n=1 Tax=Pseudomonas sp. AN-1 TaxID=3096605 RepID=UPI002A69CA04|nr:hypothetical protein [Pseudomonas sp. AN-1]WPP47467.1 hypothetical protein SK095_08870 [Pseudomonas sp. AN-1]
MTARSPEHVSPVSKTTLLVVGQKPGKSKLDKAEELGVRQIAEEEFMGLIG